MKLFEPGRIGKLTLKNRIIMAAMNTVGSIETDGTLSPRGIDYYVARAKGGAGMIVTGATRVTREIEYSPRMHRILSADGKVHVAWLNELAEAVHDYSAKLAVQFQAGRGRVAVAKVLETGFAVAPSPVPCFFEPKVKARALTLEEVERLIESFEVAAEVVKVAGADAIELNFHSGYLGDEFLTALWNERTDRFGGNLNGRFTFPLEVIKAVKRGAGADFPLLFKFGLTHYLEGGREIEEGLEIARMLETAGINALTIDAGCYETQYITFPPVYQPPGCLVDLAERVKKAVKIPVIAVGKLGYPDFAERVLQEGKADFIALGRPLLADPEWPNKAKAGKVEEIRPCIGDHEGCLERSFEEKYLSCTVNPATGMETKFTIGPAEKKRSVLVVGGGPGGMEAARVSALRGHKVVLWEKGEILGGNLIPASVPDFKQDYRRLVDYLACQMKKLGVDVQLGKEATPSLINEMKPEVLFIATGAIPIIPEIPGIEKRKVVTASDVLLDKREVGESVAIIGGGLIGCETALYLRQKKKRVTLVEILDDLMRNVFPTNRMHLLKLIRDVKILTGRKVLEITDDGLFIADQYDKRETLRADTVVIAVGLKSENGLLKSRIDNSTLETFAIGDCVEPRKVMQAIWEGFRTARLV